MTLASFEHAQGQSILAKEISAFGYYTIMHLKQPNISCEQFLSLVRKFDMPHIKSFPDFANEFDYLLRNLDIRYFAYQPESQLDKLRASLLMEPSPTSLSSLGLNQSHVISDIDLNSSVFGFDLFRRASIERNW